MDPWWLSLALTATALLAILSTDVYATVTTIWTMVIMKQRMKQSQSADLTFRLDGTSKMIFGS